MIAGIDTIAEEKNRLHGNVAGRFAAQIVKPATDVRRFALRFDAGVVAFDIVGALIKGDFDFLIVGQALQRGLDRRTAK